jgi:hypothetical protein
VRGQGPAGRRRRAAAAALRADVRQERPGAGVEERGERPYARMIPSSLATTTPLIELQLKHNTARPPIAGYREQLTNHYPEAVP